jgi:hypothetical protein
VELVVQLCFPGKVGDKGVLHGVVITLLRQEIVTTEDAVGVHINHKHRLVTGVEQDRIGSLRSDALDREQSGTGL